MNRTNEKFLNDVAKLCRVSVNEIASASQRELVDNFILPKAVEETGQDTRGWRIGDGFMQFMSDWGQYCVKEDWYTGEILMEIAMQRLAKGAIIRDVHKNAEFDAALALCDFKELDTEETKAQKRANRAKLNVEYLASNVNNLYASYNPWFALPKEYRKYSNWYDQPGLMSQTCWNFIEKNLLWAMENLHNPVWRGHAEKLCAGLLQHLDENGQELGGYLWNEACVVKTLKEVYAFAEDMACKHFGVQKVAQILLPTWRDHKAFFKKYEKQLDFSILFGDWGQAEPGLNYESEGSRYFGSKKLWWLKTFGLAKNHIASKVKEEMLVA